MTDHRDGTDPTPVPAIAWNAADDGIPVPYREPVHQARSRTDSEVASEAAAVGSAGERAARPAELPPEAVADGFTLEPVGDRVRLFHHCGNVVRVDDPDDPKLRWHIRTHRCGPATSEWHIGVVEQPRQRYLARPAHLVRGRSGRRGRGPDGVK